MKDVRIIFKQEICRRPRVLHNEESLRALDGICSFLVRINEDDELFDHVEQIIDKHPKLACCDIALDWL